MSITIRPFTPGDAQGVVGVILPIQREEFGFPITAADQPDLAEIPEFYQSGAGGFWVAEAEGQVVGTIGLKDIGEARAALRKMFVAEAFRGRSFGVAAQLLETLLAHARAEGLAEVLLGTTDKFLAAHRFYERNGFGLIAQSDLPKSFPLMGVDTRFYRLRLKG